MADKHILLALLKAPLQPHSPFPLPTFSTSLEGGNNDGTQFDSRNKRCLLWAGEEGAILGRDFAFLRNYGDVANSFSIIFYLPLSFLP